MTTIPGLTAAQVSHAAAMVAEVRRRGLPQRAAVVVIETALVESNLRIYANGNIPASMAIPHEAVGYDHASVGPLQQQVPSWGTALDCMDPAKACAKFLDGAGNNPGLLHLPQYRMAYVGHGTATSWTQLPTGSAAQAVQVSAFPDRYQQQEARATQIVAALWSQDLLEEIMALDRNSADYKNLVADIAKAVLAEQATSVDGKAHGTVSHCLGYSVEALSAITKKVGA